MNSVTSSDHTHTERGTSSGQATVVQYPSEWVRRAKEYHPTDQEHEPVELSEDDWKQLAFAFYSLAHNDSGDFDSLEHRLKDTEVGKLCTEYIRTGDHQSLDKAGFLLTGTEEWYIYLGRIF